MRYRHNIGEFRIPKNSPRPHVGGCFGARMNRGPRSAGAVAVECVSPTAPALLRYQHNPLVPPVTLVAGRRKQGTMAISDIAVPTSRKPGPPCAVCGNLASLPDVEAAALRTLLADTTWRYTELSAELEREGVNLTPFMLSWHARGRCEARERLR